MSRVERVQLRVSMQMSERRIRFDPVFWKVTGVQERRAWSKRLHS